MLLTNTVGDRVPAGFQFSIESDPITAAFLGSSSIVKMNDPFSGVVYNGFQAPGAYLEGLDLANSEIGKTLENFIRDYTPWGMAYKAGEEVRKQDGAGTGLWDWKFWAVSIGLALLGLVFVAGGILSFR